MSTQKADLEEIERKAKSPAANFGRVNRPRREPAVQQADYHAKDQRLPPAAQTGYLPPQGRKIDPKAFLKEVTGKE